MADALIVGLSTGPIWGCSDTDYGAGKSHEYERGGDVTELKNGQSQIIAAAFHSDKNTLSYSAKIIGTIPTDPRGTALTIGENTGYLDKITVTKQEGDFADIKIDLLDYPDFATASSSGSGS